MSVTYGPKLIRATHIRATHIRATHIREGNQMTCFARF